MEDRELQKINERKDNIKKYIDKLYNTTSVNAEANITEELVKTAKNCKKHLTIGAGRV